MFLFTDFVTDVKARYNYGFWYLILISITLLINFCFTFGETITQLRKNRKKKARDKQLKDQLKKVDEEIDLMMTDIRMCRKNRWTEE